MCRPGRDWSTSRLHRVRSAGVVGAGGAAGTYRCGSGDQTHRLRGQRVGRVVTGAGGAIGGALGTCTPAGTSPTCAATAGISIVAPA